MFIHQTEFRKLIARSPEHLFSLFLGAPEHHPFFFRGQRNKNWDIKSLLERQVRMTNKETGENVPRSTYRRRRDMEKRLLYDFKRRAKNYPNDLRWIPAEEENLEWLSLMRHYGAPTRLVDWTYSVFIALYFAVSHETPRTDEHPCVWAINTGALATAGRKHYEHDGGSLRLDRLSDGTQLDEPPPKFGGEELHFGSRRFHQLVHRRVGEACVSNGYNEVGVLEVHPEHLTSRMQLQQGVMVAPCDLGNGFMHNITGGLGLEGAEPTGPFPAEQQEMEDLYGNVAVAKIEIPRSALDRFQVCLEQMNLRQEVLFPDVSGAVGALTQNRSPMHFTRVPSWERSLSDLGYDQEE